ncbi:hypothetical protein [Aeromicrobium sp. Leaf350]|uniref:hypothetical protein n=1 Tax=Aeromicrobium sp. Leaf350 TaxID=2876565 RepID=UPI001E38C9AE|nr:hypothetical protein [Aeromicrobium sp. Leaf350]
MTSSSRDLAATAAWVIAAVLLLAYPALRPWEDETTLAGVVAWDSPAWVVSHTAAILGLVALVAAASLDAVAGRLRTAVPVLLAAGTALVLPYYGAEAYGLPMIGELARETEDASLVDLGDGFRYAPVPVTLFSVGLLLLAVAGVLLLLGARRSALPAGAILLGIWLVAFLPQFFGPAPVRIAHGVLALAAGLLLALAVRRGSRV